MRLGDVAAGEAYVGDEYVAGVLEVATAAGLDHVGVAPAHVLQRARRELHARRAAGLHDGMAFTFRNPDRSTDPQRAVPGARALVVGARSYDRPTPPQPEGRANGRVARYAWADHYDGLRAALRAVAARLRADGWKAVVFADDNALVDREVAYEAGLGWFGKNANVLVPGRGSFVVLGSVVTTAPLVDTSAAATPVADHCGGCRRCIDHCPTGAIVAPGVIDAGRCLAWVLQKPGAIPVELRSAVGDRVYGCDDCQEVCPPTIRGSRPSSRPPEAHTELDAWVDLVALLEMDDEALLERYGRWYIAGREPRWLRRNALVALGNVAARGSSSDEVHTVLARYVDHCDPMLRDHAVWAAGRAGMADLAEARR